MQLVLFFNYIQCSMHGSKGESIFFWKLPLFTPTFGSLFVPSRLGLKGLLVSVKVTWRPWKVKGQGRIEDGTSKRADSTTLPALLGLADDAYHRYDGHLFYLFCEGVCCRVGVNYLLTIGYLFSDSYHGVILYLKKVHRVSIAIERCQDFCELLLPLLVTCFV